MKKGPVRDYIRSGAEMPHRHTEEDVRLQAEVSYGFGVVTFRVVYAMATLAVFSLHLHFIVCRLVSKYGFTTDVPSVTSTCGQMMMLGTTALLWAATESVVTIRYVCTALFY